MKYVANQGLDVPADKDLYVVDGLLRSVERSGDCMHQEVARERL